MGRDLNRLEEEVAEILELPDREQSAAFANLRAANPEHADLIERWERALRVVDAGTARDADSIATEPPPETVGPYRIVRVLGEGGMGTVYLAEQSEPVERRVAVKVIKLGMDSKAVLRRFELERQALAMMSHDYIAKVFDAGTTDRGQPYFVMEYVEGIPLTEYCDRERQTLNERLNLIQRVCSGVQHAHQKGLIHRDLKPNNILVRESEGQAVPKIIDFGLARATDQDALRQSLMTEREMVVGTPEYMAPEQADPTGVDIDTRTDVYSLGVILYEVLVGVLPVSRRELSVSVVSMLRAVRELEPPRPSMKLTSLGASSAEIAAARRTTPSALRRALRSDLDWVVLRAMDKDPARRYSSVGELAQDLERYQRHEPLRAGPPSTGYRIKKILRRYRGQFAAAGAILLTLIAATIMSALFAIDAGHKEKEANIQGQLAAQRAEEARASAELANQRADQLTEEKQRTADALNRFRLVRYRLELDELVATAEGLHPPWPENQGSLSSWLAQSERLMDDLVTIRTARDALRATATNPGTAEDPRVQARSREAIEPLQKEIGALQAAQAVRLGTATVAEAVLEPELANRSAFQLASLAVPFVVQDRAQRVWGQEARGLALARLAVQKASEGDPSYDHALALGLLSLAELAVGRDAEARTAVQGYLDLADASQRDVVLQVYDAVHAAIANAAPDRASRRIAALQEQAEDLRDAALDAIDWQLEDPADQFLHDSLMALVADVVRLRDPDDGLIAGVEARLDWAGRVQELSVERHRDRWQQAAEALAAPDGEDTSALYREVPIQLAPQLGLVPIGPNPVTGLWEFYHLRSAWDASSSANPADLEIPTHGPDGSIDVRGDTGIVFVLIPGGTFTMGAQSSDPNGPNYDPQAKVTETPHQVMLDPYLLAKHELTQGQWLRLGAESNPSFHSAGRGVQELIITLAHPVEQIQWTEVSTLLDHHGLVLPTEAQWEYGCRAGTTTPWWTGSNRDSLIASGIAANLADLSAKRLGVTWPAIEDWPELDDGFAVHAPVDALRANPWGLHHMTGNVFEWCQDRYVPYSRPVQAGDGARTTDQHNDRVFRGASFGYTAENARSANRVSARPDTANDFMGARAARALR